jgi:hypothetical protein
MLGNELEEETCFSPVNITINVKINEFTRMAAESVVNYTAEIDSAYLVVYVKILCGALENLNKGL